MERKGLVVMIGVVNRWFQQKAKLEQWSSKHDVGKRTRDSYLKGNDGVY